MLRPRKPEHFNFIPFVALFAFVGLLSLIVYIYLLGVLTASKSLLGWRVLIPFFAIVSLAWLSIYIAAEEGWSLEWLASAGAIFVVLMAVVTVIGLLLAVTRLEEIHGRILDYAHLAERLDMIIDREYDRVTEKGKRRRGRILIFANAPAIGNVSASPGYSVFRPRLRELLKHHRVEVKLACHSWQAEDGAQSRIERFYRRHWEQALEPNVLLDRIEESYVLLRDVSSVAGTNDSAPKQLFRLTESVQEVPFHLFMTSTRAILYTALSFPEESRRRSNSQPVEVRIVGFETGDRSILQALEDGFERRLSDRNVVEPDNIGPVAR